MIRLAAILWLMTGPTLAGVAVLIALTTPELGLSTFVGLPLAAGVGFLLGLPAAVVFARMVKANS